jgi:hypothetical protein
MWRGHWRICHLVCNHLLYNSDTAAVSNHHLLLPFLLHLLRPSLLLSTPQVASLRTTLAAAKPVETVEKLAAQAVPAAQQLTSSAVQVVEEVGPQLAQQLKMAGDVMEQRAKEGAAVVQVGGWVAGLEGVGWGWVGAGGVDGTGVRWCFVG